MLKETDKIFPEVMVPSPLDRRNIESLVYCTKSVNFGRGQREAWRDYCEA
jgi:hypothetical protein